MQSDLPFCNRCKYIFNTCKGENFSVPSNEDLNKNLSNGNCGFCFGMFNMDIYKEVINNIKNNLKDYDYTDLKIITNFVCVFDLFHWFVRENFKRLKLNEDSLMNISSATLRKCFKALFVPIIEKEINSTFVSKGNGDIEIVISFDFGEEIYSKLNEIISQCSNNNPKYLISPTDDKSKIKTITIEILNDVLIGKIRELFSDAKVFPSVEVKYKLLRTSFYICGKYVKLSRDLGQTKWVKNGIRLCASSVDEEIRSRLCKYFGNTMNDLVFSGGGREDRDVRMLGRGREFIYEVNNAKKKFNIDYDKIIENFNLDSSLVKISNLHQCDKKYFTNLKNSEDKKQKTYLCLIWIEKEITKEMISKIEDQHNIAILQKTPLRVLHKRVLKDREKEIIKMKVIKKINDHFMILEVVSSAGTYIKEFIHGDLMRTQPSLGSIIESECDIIQLDVNDILY